MRLGDLLVIVRKDLGELYNSTLPISRSLVKKSRRFGIIAVKGRPKTDCRAYARISASLRFGFLALDSCNQNKICPGGVQSS